MSKQAFILFFILFIQACSTVSEVPPEQTRVFIDENNNLNYFGSITKDANNLTMQLYSDSKIKPSLLIISSGGGSIHLGLQLGNWIHDKKLDIEVETVCGSSCANYVFPAAHSKLLRKDSVLVWHGSAWQKAYDEYTDEEKLPFNMTISDLRKREIEFFSRIKVDNILPIYGQDKFGWSDYWANIIGKGATGFDYRLCDLEKMGLSNIILVDKEWNWRKYRTSKRHTVKRIKLQNNYRYTNRRFERTSH